MSSNNRWFWLPIWPIRRRGVHSSNDGCFGSSEKSNLFVNGSDRAQLPATNGTLPPLIKTGWARNRSSPLRGRRRECKSRKPGCATETDGRPHHHPHRPAARIAGRACTPPMRRNATNPTSSSSSSMTWAMAIRSASIRSRRSRRRTSTGWRRRGCGSPMLMRRRPSACRAGIAC